MSSGKKRQLSSDSERVPTQESSAHDITKPAGDKTSKTAKRSRRVAVSTETGDTTTDKQGWPTVALCVSKTQNGEIQSCMLSH